MLLISAMYILGMAAPPILLGFCWWGWFRYRPSEGRGVFFFSGLLAATVNFLLWWAWVIWLQFHSGPSAGIIRNIVGNFCFYLLIYSVVAAIAGKGRYRILLAISCVLALIPWIPIGVL
jgi:hypothetical protein